MVKNRGWTVGRSAPESKAALAPVVNRCYPVMRQTVSSRVTTVGTFTKPEDAHLLRMRLEAAGLQAFILDENVIQLNMLFSYALGGVRVQVADDDLQEVREFLAEDNGLPPEAGARRCSKCGCTAVETEWFSRRFAYLTLFFLGIPILLFRRRLRCTSCLHTWEP